MLKVVPILGTLLLALVACGQRGPLYLPTGEAGAARATLPQALNPAVTASGPVNSGMGNANPAPHQ